jgi:hypothetical protein
MMSREISASISLCSVCCRVWDGLQLQRGISSANGFFFFPLKRDKARKRVNKELNKYISEKERSHKYKIL